MNPPELSWERWKCRHPAIVGFNCGYLDPALVMHILKCLAAYVVGACLFFNYAEGALDAFAFTRLSHD